MSTWKEWLDHRTGLVRFTRRYLFDPLPGGARWRQTWVALLLFTFFMQVVTGFFLLSHYSASAQTAWESVFHLQYHLPGGWFLRALHATSAQCFVVLLALHLLQVVLYRAYLAPRELNFLLLLVLLPLAIGLSVTGWLLPFDQKGYWAARVPLNLLGIVPGLGPALQKVLLGGPEVGHLTLTRFAALHTVLLPLLTGLVLFGYWGLARRHGFPAPGPASKTGQAYWPHQALKDVLACLVLTVALLAIVLWPWFTHAGDPGVELLAPANPAEPYAAARPEWFMLWLFQFLKFFPGGTEIWGAVVIPSLVFFGLALLPWLARWHYGPAVASAGGLMLFAGVVALMLIAWNADHQDPHYQSAVRQARDQAERVKTLAQSPTGIPRSGALALLQDDPLTQGPRLFARHCASCHRFEGHDGSGGIPAEPQSASDLKGFASRAWLTRFLTPEHVASTDYFGGTRFASGKMVRFVTRDLAELTGEEQAQLQKMILAVSAEAQLPAQASADSRDAAAIVEGRRLMIEANFACTDCHSFRQPDPDATAPDLTGYGSRDWLGQFLTDPGHERFYGQRNDRMPAFGKDKLLTQSELDLLADWLRGDWYEPARARPTVD